MALTGKIADGVIQIALAGLDLAKAQLAAVHAQAIKTGNALKEIGSTSAKGFAVLTGTITGLLREADPVRFSLFTAQIQILSIQIGRTFIPLLQDATKWLAKVSDYFRHLTDEQRESILYWTKLGIGILAAGTAIGLLVQGITVLITTLRALAVAIAVVEAETGVGLILVALGAATALAGLLYQSGLLEKGLNKLGVTIGSLGGYGKGLGKVWDSLSATAEKLWDRVSTVFGNISDSAYGLFSSMSDVVSDLAEPIGSLIGKIIELGGALLGLAVDVQGGAFTALFKVAKLLVDVFGPVLVFAIKQVATAIELIVSAVLALVEALQQAMDYMKRLAGFRTPGRKDDDGAGNWKDGASSSGRDTKSQDNSDKFAPLVNPKVQIFGIEEAFRKAQEGARFDPSRLAQQELIKASQRTATASERTAENTERRPAAETVGGNF